MKKLLILLLIVGCEELLDPDTTAPTVVITYPANPSTLTETATVTVDVVDDGDIGIVKLLVDGIETYADSTAPYQFTWDVCVQSTGTHTLMAKADDGAGNQGQSDLLTFTINANYDCADVCGGDKLLDNCEVCDDDITNDCTADCNGDWGGTALEDNCGTCDSDTTNDCVQDCAGVWGGTDVELWGECYNIEETTELHLYGNQLTGSIPSEIGNLTNLTTLYLYENQLTGEIPSEIGNLTNLTDLRLRSNQLTGSIPSEIGNLTNLTRLYLTYNQLTGSIPSEIGNLTNLEFSSLSNNQLIGEIPQAVCDLIEERDNLFINNFVANNLDINNILDGNNLINTCGD